MENGLLTGLTDYSHHEIYATLWLKLAYERLNIDTSSIKIPKEFDSYARMFWMDKKDVETKTPIELFSDFYELQNNQPMSDEQKAFVEDLIEQVWEDEK